MTPISKPQCLGFIMDGNRRWATERRLSTLEGHKRGQEVFLDCVQWVKEAAIPHAVFYAFSTENWHRSETEVGYLMKLFGELLTQFQAELKEHQVRVKLVGRREDFSTDLQTQMATLEAQSMKYKGTTIWIALSYGGRAEIVTAVNKAVALGEAVDEKTFEQLLWTADLPDPDMIIRTGGEERLSNFLTWKSVYSELYFIDTQWPALSKSDFLTILNEYENRERRNGA